MGLKQHTRRFHRPGKDSQEFSAAVELDLDRSDDRFYLDSVVRASKRESDNPWKWYDRLGEVHYSVNRSARIAGYASIHCEKVAPNGEVEEIVDTGPAADIVKGIYSSIGGVRGLVDRFYGQQKIAADSYLIRVLNGDEYDGYEFISSSEIDGASLAELQTGAVQDKKLRWITLPLASSGDGVTGSGRFGRDIEPRDFLGRVWTPSRRFIDVPDTPLTALNTECDLLDKLTNLMLARLLQRFALAGILYVPAEIQEAKVSTVNETGAIRKDDVLRILKTAMDRNVQNWDQGKAYQPIMVRGPGEHAQNFMHIKFDQELFKTDLALRNELIGRILFGLDITQQAAEGVGNTNHWSAWAVSDEERRIAVQPDMETFCWAMTRLVLHKQLLETKMAPEEILKQRVGFDLSAAAVRSNQQEDGRQAYDRGEINGSALRRTGGFKDSDVMVGDELVRHIGVRLKNPYLATFGLPEQADFDWEKIEPSKAQGPMPGSAADEPESGPGEGDPGSPDDGDSDTPRTEKPG